MITHYSISDVETFLLEKQQEALNNPSVAAYVARLIDDATLDFERFLNDHQVYLEELGRKLPKFKVTFRGKELTVAAGNHARAGWVGIRQLGYIPRLVGQHDLTVIPI